MGIKVHTSAGTYAARRFTESTWRVTEESTGDVVGTVVRTMVPDMSYAGTGTATVAEWNGRDTLWRAVRDIVREVTGSRVMTIRDITRDDVVSEVTERREAEARRRLNERLEKERWESEGGASRSGPATQSAVTAH